MLPQSRYQGMVIGSGAGTGSGGAGGGYSYHPSSSSSSSLSSANPGGIGYEGQIPDYFRRLLDLRQMDFEAAFEQVFHLLSTEPEKAFKHFYYRKQTKNQWARDDPAFLVLEAVAVSVGALAWAVALVQPSLWRYVWAVLYVVVVDWLVVGTAVASLCWHVCNRYLKQHSLHAVEQDVEWLHAFDIHINAYLCSAAVTFVGQYFLLPLLMSRSLLAAVLSNTLYAAALLWYAYITHVGYKALPFLAHTQVFFWYSLLAVVFVWTLLCVLMVLGMHINLTRIVVHFHYGVVA